MAGYIGLFKYTARGIADLKGSPDRIKQAREAGERSGVKVIGIWVTMGEYDLVGVFEAADDKVIAGFLLALAMRGNVTTQTMRAFDEKEFAEIVGRLP